MEMEITRPTLARRQAVGLPDIAATTSDATKRAVLTAIGAGDVPGLAGVLADARGPAAWDGWLPEVLHHAMTGAERKAAMVRILLKAGADPLATSPTGAPAIHALPGYGHRETHGNAAAITAALIAHGAEIDAPDQVGLTPLQRALLVGSEPVIEALLIHGADPNRRIPASAPTEASPGRTPLMIALGRAKIIGLLLAFGADPAGECADGLRVEHVAADDVATSDAVRLSLAQIG